MIPNNKRVSHFCLRVRRREIICAAIAGITPLCVSIARGGVGVVSDGSLGTNAVHTVNGAGGYSYSITGGTIRGTDNLFHSFSSFNLNKNDGATFNITNSNVTNVLARVTNGQASTIDGNITVSGGSPTGVDFYLMNPAGVVFGPDSVMLDTKGTFYVT